MPAGMEYLYAGAEETDPLLFANAMRPIAQIGPQTLGFLMEQDTAARENARLREEMRARQRREQYQAAAALDAGAAPPSAGGSRSKAAAAGGVPPAASFTPTRSQQMQADASLNQLGATLREMELAEAASQGDQAAADELARMGVAGRRDVGGAPHLQPSQGRFVPGDIFPALGGEPGGGMALDDAYVTEATDAPFAHGGEMTRPIGAYAPEARAPGSEPIERRPEDPLGLFGIAPGAITDMTQAQAAKDAGLLPADADMSDFLNFLPALDRRRAAAGLETHEHEVEKAEREALAIRQRDLANLKGSLSNFVDLDEATLDQFSQALLDNPDEAKKLLDVTQKAADSARDLQSTRVTQGGQTERLRIEQREAERLRGVAAAGELAEDALGDVDAALAALDAAEAAGDDLAADNAYVELQRALSEMGGTRPEAAGRAAAGRATREGERRVKAEAQETKAGVAVDKEKRLAFGKAADVDAASLGVAMDRLEEKNPGASEDELYAVATHLVKTDLKEFNRLYRGQSNTDFATLVAAALGNAGG